VRYYCGFEFAPLDDWQSYVGEVRAPSNYKDQAKIADYISRRIDELSRDAETHPLAGSLSRAVVVKDGDTVFDERSFVGVKFLEFISKDSGLDKNPATTKDNLLIVGYKMHTAARLAALEYIAVNGALPFALHWALELDPEFRYNRIPGYMDPVSVLSGSSTHGVAAVAKKFGLPVNQEEAESLAVVASQLASRLGL